MCNFDIIYSIKEIIPDRGTLIGGELKLLNPGENETHYSYRRTVAVVSLALAGRRLQLDDTGSNG